jgi:hypothetical protein
MLALVLVQRFALSAQTLVHYQEKNMKTLRKLSGVLVLTLILGLPALAGELQTPPCAQPAPGELQTPPCQGAAAGDTGDPSNSWTAMTANPTFTEIATEIMENMMSI